MIELAIVILLLVSFMFSGIEAGILSVNRVRLRHHVNLGDKAAIKLERLLARPGRLLGTVLLVTNLMNIWAVTLISQQFVAAFGVWRGYAATFVVCLPLLVLVLELFPKSLFRRFPYRALAAAAELLRVTYLLLSPLLKFGEWIARGFRNEELPENKIFAGREDFKYWTIESERVGALGKVERQMIHNVVDFRGVVVREVMVPIERVPCVGAGSSVDELLFLSHKHHADRFPVVSRDGEIAGQVTVFQVLLDRDAARTVSFYQRRILRFPPDEPGFNAIRKLRAARARLALVVDAEDRPLGIVTSDDLIMRLVSLATAQTPP
jgi:CBS domain containing-hemolysin-like protein